MKNNLDIFQIVSILKSVIPQGEELTPLHEPLFIGNENNYVRNCVDSGWVSTIGKYINLFEQKLWNLPV